MHTRAALSLESSLVRPGSSHPSWTRDKLAARSGGGVLRAAAGGCSPPAANGDPGAHAGSLGCTNVEIVRSSTSPAGELSGRSLHRDLDEERSGERPMITLRCLNCGLTLMYEGSEADFCPRCLARARQAVQLIPISDQPSSMTGCSMGRLRIQTSVQDNRHMFVLDGELDIGSAPMLEAALAESCAAGAREVVLDMGGVEFIDSSGLSAIVRGKMLCEEHRCSYCLTPAQRPVQGVFEVTGVVDRLQFRDTAPV
jgi:anti-anti-sigma factor